MWTDKTTVHVVGSLNLDHILRVGHIPGAGETVLASATTRAAGGKGANQAVAAASAGARTRMIGCVGDDDAGREVLESLQRSGVEIEGVKVGPGGTGSAFVVVDAAGENAIVVAPGANQGLGPATVSEALSEVSSNDVVVTQGEIRADAVKQAARIAHRVGAPLVLNLAPVIDVDLVALRPSIVVVNEHEVRELAERLRIQSLPMESLASQISRRCRTAVVVTLGPAGAMIAWPTHSERVPPVSTSHVVDTTGAGDAFVGALAAALSFGAELTTAVRWGTAAGALAVQATGAQGGRATRDAINRALAVS